jgi:hypothetical protein
MARLTGIQIEFRPIHPEQMRGEGAIIAAMSREVQKILETAEQEGFDSATATWEHKPKWTIRIKSRKRDLVGRLATQSKPFTWVELGTKLRWRKMSPDFSPKSRVKNLQAHSGSGRATGFFKTRPRPGITARDFRVVVAEKMQPKFESNVTTALVREAGMFFSGRRGAVSISLGPIGG